MCSGEHILMKGKSEERAICTASAVFPHPTGPTININTVNLGSVHTKPKEFENTAHSIFLRLGLLSTLIRHENGALFPHG